MSASQRAKPRKSRRSGTPAAEIAGISRWDCAPFAPCACARCGARVRMSEIEPPSGGGPSYFLLRCSRCRHEFETRPVLEVGGETFDLAAAWKEARKTHHA